MARWYLILNWLINYSEPKDVMLGSGQQFELTITDEKVKRYTDIRRKITLALETETINSRIFKVAGCMGYDR